MSAFAVDNHDLKIDVQVENSEAAPRYAGVTVKNCKIGPSPEWMQNCLRTAGITPKNNLVDITNFVLFELGQPCTLSMQRRSTAAGSWSEPARKVLRS